MPGSRRIPRQHGAPAVTPTQARHLPVGGRGTVTGTLTALELHGLEIAVPHMRLILTGADGDQIAVYADRSVYEPVQHQLRRGAEAEVAIRIRDHLLHRLAVEHLSITS